MYILDGNGRAIYVYDLVSNTQVLSFTLPWTPNTYALAVDPSGNVYLARGNTVSQFNSAGQIQWTTNLQTTIDGLYLLSSGQLGVVQRGQGGSTLLDATGLIVGSNAIIGSTFTTDLATGDIISTDTKYVRIYDKNGTLLSTFGAAQTGNAVGPFHFYELGAAAVASDGRLYIADAGRGIEMATSDGLYQGVASDSTLGNLTERSSMAFYNGTIFFANGGQWNSHQGVSSISLADLQNLAAQPHPPQPVLGYGVASSTTAIANYYAPGQTPQVNLTFDSWWTAHSSDVVGTITVRERKQILARQTGTSQTFQLPSTASGSAFTIPVTLPPARPGYYQVETELLKGNVVVGSDCLYYGVGAPGATLNMGSLPDAPDFGGASPARSVALAQQLGLHAVRLTVDWSKLLPNGPNSTNPIDFSAYDAEFQLASQEAVTAGTTIVVEMGLGNATEDALVANGLWGQRVQEFVNHYKGIIHYWESWNEPNNSFPGPSGTFQPSEYVNSILIPLYNAVKAADPTAKVIAGSTNGVLFDYWDGIGQAGGFNYMDIVGLHVYPGHNRSFEEEGLPDSLKKFHTLLARYNATALPIWDTESAWWSDGPANIYSQADKIVREALLSYDAGISNRAYFILEGGYGLYDVTLSLIQYTRPQDAYYVKPAALATMTYQQQIGNRPYLGLLNTGTPHTYAALFGQGAGNSGDLLVLWADDMQVNEGVAVGTPSTNALTVVDLLGDSSSVPVQNGMATLSLTGSPQYVLLPAGVTPALSPQEPFGPDLALAASGAIASASSQAPTNPATQTIDGVSDAANNGEWTSISAWASGVGDITPTLTITFPTPQAVDRIIISSHSIGSIVPGLRDYDVQTQNPDGSWATAASVRGDFYWHRHIVSLQPRVTSALRIVCYSVNYGGMAGGAQPWFWPTDSSSLSSAGAPWYGPSIIYEVEAYGPPAPPPTQTPAATATNTPAATATPTNTPVSVGVFHPVRVNAGGPAYQGTGGQVWAADTGFVGGSTSATGHAVAGTTDGPLYQSERYGNFTYTFPAPVGDYNVTLKFAETTWSTAGKRVFNVAINGQPVLSNFDILSQVPAYTALDESFPVHVTGGQIVITFTTVKDNAKVDAIAIDPVGVPGPTSTPTSTPTNTSTPGPFSKVRVNAGGPAYQGTGGQVWAADTGFVGGSTSATGHAVAGTTDGPLYQSERYGNFTYTFPAPVGDYNVTLKFAETTWSTAGKRVFNVAINGQPVLSNFDILSQVPAYTALDESFPVHVTGGQIVITFTTVKDNAKVDAIAIDPALT